MACSRCSADRLRGWEGQTFSIRCWRWSFLLIIWGGAVLANRALGSHSPAQKGRNWTGTYWRRKFRQHCLTRDSAERKEFKPDNCTPPSGATVPSKCINRLIVHHRLSHAKCTWNCVSNFHNNRNNHHLPMWGLECQDVVYLRVPHVPVSLHKAHTLLAASLLFMGFHCLACEHLQSLDYSSIPLC